MTVACPSSGPESSSPNNAGGTSSVKSGMSLGVELSEAPSNMSVSKGEGLEERRRSPAARTGQITKAEFQEAVALSMQDMPSNAANTGAAGGAVSGAAPQIPQATVAGSLVQEEVSAASKGEGLTLAHSSSP
jgi:hypothetical protein